jgi:hypothetical protein
VTSRSSARVPYLARQLSVQKVVLTLTSDDTEIYLSTKDTWFILVPAGAVRPAVVCSGHYIARTVVLVEGWLQARRERRPGPQVPEVLIEASGNIVEKAESV